MCQCIYTGISNGVLPRTEWAPTFGSEFTLVSLPYTYSNNFTIIRYNNILTCGNPATCFGQFQEGILQKYTMARYVVGVPLAVKDINVFIVVIKFSWKCSSWFPLHCCRATKYFVMLFTKRKVFNIVVLCLYSCLNYPACKSHVLRAIMLPVACLSVCAIFFHIMS